MIVSEDVTLKLDKPVANEQIDLLLKEKGLEVLRWAITEVDGDLYTIRLSKEI